MCERRQMRNQLRLAACVYPFRRVCMPVLVITACGRNSEPPLTPAPRCVTKCNRQNPRISYPPASLLASTPVMGESKANHPARQPPQQPADVDEPRQALTRRRPQSIQGETNSKYRYEAVLLPCGPAGRFLRTSRAYNDREETKQGLRTDRGGVFSSEDTRGYFDSRIRYLRTRQVRKSMMTHPELREAPRGFRRGGQGAIHAMSWVPHKTHTCDTAAFAISHAQATR